MKFFVESVSQGYDLPLIEIIVIYLLMNMLMFVKVIWSTKYLSIWWDGFFLIPNYQGLGKGSVGATWLTLFEHLNIGY